MRVLPRGVLQQQVQRRRLRVGRPVPLGRAADVGVPAGVLHGGPAPRPRPCRLDVELAYFGPWPPGPSCADCLTRAPAWGSSDLASLVAGQLGLEMPDRPRIQNKDIASGTGESA